MITLKNVKSLEGSVSNYSIESTTTQTIDGQNKLLMIPALIDTDPPVNVLDRVSSFLNWGISEVFNPNPKSISTFKQRNTSLNGLKIHEVLSGITADDFNGIGKVASIATAIRTTIDFENTALPAPYGSAIDRLFQIAAQENLTVIITLLQGQGAPSDQRKAALKAVNHAIELTEKYSGQLCLQHLRTHEEVKALREAQHHGILACGEVAYPHLFISDDGKKKDGPFLPSKDDQTALWEAVNNNIIELIGSGPFAPPELMLPMLLDAVNRGKMKFETLVGVTRQNAEAIFNLTPTKDIVLVDLEKQAPIPAQFLGNGFFAAFGTESLKGWPVYTIANGEMYKETSNKKTHLG